MNMNKNTYQNYLKALKAGTAMDGKVPGAKALAPKK